MTRVTDRSASESRRTLLLLDALGRVREHALETGLQRFPASRVSCFHHHERGPAPRVSEFDPDREIAIVGLPVLAEVTGHDARIRLIPLTDGVGDRDPTA